MQQMALMDIYSTYMLWAEYFVLSVMKFIKN